MTVTILDQRLAELRRAFDEAFSLPPALPQEDGVDFLLIIAGGQPYAMRMSELAGVEVDRKRVVVPVQARGLLGLSAVQGQLVPVFDLASLLGSASTKASARWTALHRGSELIGLAFEQMQPPRRVASRDVIPLERAREQAPLSREAIRVDSRLMHVLDIPSVVLTIRQTIHRC